jgi:hypothetical protein
MILPSPPVVDLSIYSPRGGCGRDNPVDKGRQVGLQGCLCLIVSLSELGGSLLQRAVDIWAREARTPPRR